VSVGEPEQQVILVAVPVLNQIDQLPSDLAASVNDTIESIAVADGEVIDLPTAAPGYPYFALRTGRRVDAPFVIYRRARRDEEADFCVVSLMSPEQYRQQMADERSGMLSDPAIRREIQVVAGTAASIAVQAISGTVDAQTTGGPVPTIYPATHDQSGS
jgi:hypothetical protein